MSDYTFTSAQASKIVKHAGVSSIWRLNVAAADAYRNGFPNAAAAILQVAEATENECLRREPLALLKL